MAPRKGSKWPKRRKNAIVNKKCLHCRKDFQVQKNRENSAKYCSRKCKDNFQVGKPSKSKRRYSIKCKVCKKVFYVIKSLVNKRTICGKECRNKFLSIEGAKTRSNIETFKVLAKKRKGKLISNEYKNFSTKLIWECEKKHRWSAPVKHILSNSWCPICSGNNKHTLEYVKEIATDRKGFCLSKHYKNAHQKLLWKCKKGHKWLATFFKVKQGTWCPVCISRVKETKCREYFEKIFKTEFIKTKPHWLLNEEGKKLELDGYCEKLKIAFEYNGEQHYHKVPIFQRKFSLQKIKKHDNIKKILCRKNKVKLIQIPYTIDTNKLEKYILSQIKRKNIKIL